MRDKVIDVLLDVGVPAGVKGFSYICDAIEIFDTDPYYADGKMSAYKVPSSRKPSSVCLSFCLARSRRVCTALSRRPRICATSRTE